MFFGAYCLIRRHSLLHSAVFVPLLFVFSSLTCFYLAWLDISVHALNTVYALFEIGFTNSPPIPWLTLPFCILILAAYLGLAYLSRATQGFYRTFFSLFFSYSHVSFFFFFLFLFLSYTLSVAKFLFLPAYSFLDPTLKGPKLAAYIVGIAVIEVIVFCLIKMIETWRERWAVRRGLVLDSEVDIGLVDDKDWQEVERPSNVNGMA